jgi:hypothetical protein
MLQAVKYLTRETLFCTAVDYSDSPNAMYVSISRSMFTDSYFSPVCFALHYMNSTHFM